jgi:small-conductance mechanosensitive channel
VTDWLERAIGLGPDAQTKLAASLAAVLVIIAARWVVLSIAWRRVRDIPTRYRWRKTATYAAVAIGVVVVSRIWFAGLGAVTTYLGLLSAGLAIALKDLVADLAGWAFILWRRPFEVGERIQIGDHAGDVIDLRIFQFSLLEIGNWVDADQSTGRILHVPNGRVITDVLANYSRGFQYIWDEQPVLVTFESDWRTAKALLAEVASRHAAHVTGEAARQLEEASRKFMIVYSKLTPIVYTSVKDSGVLLTMRYLCEARKRRAVAEAIWEDVLTEFARRDDIDFAYPTTRFYANPQEGKTAVRAGGPGAPPPPPASPPIAPTEQRR